LEASNPSVVGKALLLDGVADPVDSCFFSNSSTCATDREHNQHFEVSRGQRL
jgi:hypothetical protein